MHLSSSAILSLKWCTRLFSFYFLLPCSSSVQAADISFVHRVVPRIVCAQEGTAHHCAWEGAVHFFCARKVLYIVSENLLRTGGCHQLFVHGGMLNIVGAQEGAKYGSNTGGCYVSFALLHASDQ